MDRSGTLLYDADCGLCIWTATRLAELAPPERLGLLALQSVDEVPEVALRVVGHDLRDAVHFVRADGTVLAGARAALAAARLIPVMGWYATLLDQPVGHALLEPLYRQVSAHRRRIGRLMGLPDTCPLPQRRLDAGIPGLTDEPSPSSSASPSTD